MKQSRYLELERNPELKLTPEEIEEGWHFCREWDGMLIYTEWPEAEVCLCYSTPEAEACLYYSTSEHDIEV